MQTRIIYFATSGLLLVGLNHVVLGQRAIAQQDAITQCAIQTNQQMDRARENAAPTGLSLLGSFQNGHGTDTGHSYGYQVNLARLGQEVLGVLTTWEGPPEGKPVNLLDVRFDEKKGEINFRANQLFSGDVRFTGKLNRDSLDGVFVHPGGHQEKVRLVQTSSTWMTAKSFWHSYSRNKMFDDCLKKQYGTEATQAETAPISTNNPDQSTITTLIPNPYIARTSLFDMPEPKGPDPLPAKWVIAADGIAVDSGGNYYLAGIKGESLEKNPGREKVFVAKFTTSGAQAWLRKLGIDSSEHARSVAVDGNGNAYVLGVTTKKPPSGSPPHSIFNEIFVAKFDGNGTQTWVKRIESAESQGASAITTDSQQNVYVLGSNYGVQEGMKFKVNPASFVAKLDQTGNQRWYAKFDDLDHSGQAIVTDKNGNAFALSGCRDRNKHVNDPASKNVCVSKIDSDGKPVWTKIIQPQMGRTAGGIAVDRDGNTYVTGLENSSNPISSDVAAGTSAFVAKLNANGNTAWIKPLQMGGRGSGRAIAVDSSNSLYIFGAQFSNQKEKDFSTQFLAKLNAAGGMTWMRTFLGQGFTMNASIQLDQKGILFIGIGGLEGGAYLAKFDSSSGNGLGSFGVTGKSAAATEAKPSSAPIAPGETILNVTDDGCFSGAYGLAKGALSEQQMEWVRDIIAYSYGHLANHRATLPSGEDVTKTKTEVMEALLNNKLFQVWLDKDIYLAFSDYVKARRKLITHMAAARGVKTGQSAEIRNQGLISELEKSQERLLALMKVKLRIKEDIADASGCY